MDKFPRTNGLMFRVLPGYLTSIWSNRAKAVVYSKYMPVFFREFLIERGIQLIEADDDEYDSLGTNLLALEPGKVILIDGCPKIKSELEAIGIEVMTYEGKELSFRGTGGPTCLTCPVDRG